MKKLLYILILFTLSAQAQIAKMPADTEFFYTYGGTNFDEARDIKETPDKGYILAGTTSSFGQGNTSVYMIKTDSLGNHLWSSVQGGAQNDWAYTLQLTPDSGFFVAGYSNSFNANNQLYSSPYYFKTNKNGNLIWQKSIDVGSWSFIYGSCPLPDGGFILCGQTYYATPNGSSDGYLMRINKSGDTLWTNHYGGIQDEIFNSVCLINNKIYAVGSNATHPTDTVADGWVVKLDTNGNKLQEAFLSYGHNSHHLRQEILNGITPYTGNSFIVCGLTNHNFIDSSATTGLIERYDTTLTIIDSITIRTQLQTQQMDTTNGYFVAFSKVINISYTNICIVGSAFGGNGGINLFFELLNSSFGWYYVSSRHEGGLLNDYGYSGILTSGGKVIGVGSTQGFSGMPANYCTDNNLGLEDVFLVRFDSDSITNTIVDTKTSCFADTLFLWQASIKNYVSNFNAKLFPNPTSAYAQLEITCNEQKKFTAKVYSILGSEVMSDKMPSNNLKKLDFSVLSEGSYFLKIQDENGQNVSVLKFIISR
jgi:hypothetical protein